MERFNVAYRTISGEIIVVEENHENMKVAVDNKAKMFDFDNMVPGTYYSFIGEDGAIAMVNPKCIESVRVLKIDTNEENSDKNDHEDDSIEE